MASLCLLVGWQRVSTVLFERGVARWMRSVPGSVAALVLATVAVKALGLPVETIGSKFGGVPAALPHFLWPEFSWASAQHLVMPTLTLALLGAIESLLCARVADSMIDDRHDPNQELIAQGVANLVTPLFGGIAATGTIARTMTNVRSGARSPVAGIIHAITLLAIVLVLAPLAQNIPMASLAAILLFVAWNMGDWSAFGTLGKFSVSYRTIMLASFALTVIFDITVAIEVGLVLASLFFIHRISSLTRVEPIRLPADIATLPDGTRTEAWRLFGSLFFGSVDKLEGLLGSGTRAADVVVLEMHQVINLDTSGLDALQSLLNQLDKRGATLIIAEPNEQPMSLLRRSGFLQAMGPHNVFEHLDDALAALQSRHTPKPD
jgi:SulP family sulfate permease